jgi:DNA-binding NtrC family response regulator
MDEIPAGLIRRLRETHGLAPLIGEAPTFLKAIAQLSAAALSDATVLISGETGTGKELVARAIHYLSPRVGFPFVAVNCGGLMDTLLADELFGHEPGAFTDARSRRQGLLGEAERGTVFLDEVEALTAQGQVMLLRVLEDKHFRPLGSTQEQRADVRFLAATNTALEPRVQTGAFRADLFYRLSVFAVNLPPLRDRKEDIAALATHFLQKNALPDQPAAQLSAAALAALLAFDWPGNVRELENAIIRGVRVSLTGLIGVEELGLPGTTVSGATVVPPSLRSFAALKRIAVRTFEREYLTRLMSEQHGNVTHAAQAAGKDRRELGRLLKKHDLDPRRFAG